MFNASAGGTSSTPYTATGSTTTTIVSPSSGGATSILTVPLDALTALAKNCGNGVKDANELCDDGNKEPKDGCTKLCQIEVEFACPEWGKPCVSSVQCGDGKLASTEKCDDGNTNNDDGCSADCQLVADGWQCRVPGKRCVPLCGDSKITGSEKCDDSNENSDDGCSSSCLIEIGYACTGTPSVCTKSVCGNSKTEPGESCDKGDANGLFYGDGQGCSKTCTKEPNCRQGGVTQACSTACGDANIDAGEDCDDGNALSGDGCTSDCKKESGFNCTDTDMPDTTDCSTGGGKCLVLPVTYRDFEGQQVSGGHPDFFFLGAAVTGGRTTGVVAGTNKTTCVPNAGGTKAAVPADGACPNSDASGPCLGLVADKLGSDGKPVFAKGTCPCVFTDWDRTGVLGTCPTSGTANCTLPTGVTGVTDCYVKDEGSHRLRVDATVTVIQSADTFKQWYSDSSTSTPVKGTLELAALSGNQYQFSSSAGRTIPDDVHDIFMKTGKVTSLTSGFFPLEDQAKTKICNLWPYWVSGLTTAAQCVANDGNAVPSQWDPKGSFTAGTAGTGGPAKPVTGMMRNFYFTSEVRYLFRYGGTASTLAFYGDDDVWVFINGKLALDLGAPHERLQGSVSIDSAKFGLESGKTYEIVVFHADRHPRDSNYQLTMSSFSTKRTSCAPRCGDSVTTAGEECDDGDAGNKDAADAYNACTKQCKYGPYCGDNEKNGPEECDNGVRNGAPYGDKDGCSNDCKKVHFCGDGIIDSSFDEECDGGSGCMADCKLQLIQY